MKHNRNQNADDMEKLRQALEQVTAADSTAEKETDPETGGLREAWLALGQLLSAVEPPAEEPPVGWWLEPLGKRPARRVADSGLLLRHIGRDIAGQRCDLHDAGHKWQTDGRGPGQAKVGRAGRRRDGLGRRDGPAVCPGRPEFDLRAAGLVASARFGRHGAIWIAAGGAGRERERVVKLSAVCRPVVITSRLYF